MEPEPLVGEIRIFCGTFNVKGWVFCDGADCDVRFFPELFNIIQYTYGGANGMFKVPDLRGKLPLGAGSAPGLSTYKLGQTGGDADSYTLTIPTMPPHTHTYMASSGLPGTSDPLNAINATLSGRGAKYAVGTLDTDATLNPAAVSVAGSSAPTSVSKLQAYVPVNYMICVTSRID